LALIATASHSAQKDWWVDEPERPWAEIEAKLPPYPKPANLIEFPLETLTGRRYFIDSDSISIGKDGVARYTLVMKSPGGSENVAHEGIHCKTNRYRYYAFGRPDGTWVKARNDEWRSFEVQDKTRHYGVLFSYYFCPGRSVPVESPDAAVKRLKYGVPTTRVD
jgi:hypothetical protein